MKSQAELGGCFFMLFKNKLLKKYSFKLSTLSFCLNLSLGFALAQYNVAIHAEENKNTKDIGFDADFDAGFLSGNASSIDISKFKFNNPVLPGEYNLDVYVNGSWQGRKKMVFKADKNEDQASLCFTKKQMAEYGVKAEILNIPLAASTSDCLPIETWVKGAFYDFNSNDLRLDISIPQISLNTVARDVVDKSLWDRGINAGFLSYNGGAYKVSNRDHNSPDSTSAYISLTTGLNILGWQLRHNGQWSWSDQPGSGSSYQANNTYLQRAFPQFRGLLTLGENNTSGDIFDTLRYRGVDFTSDERMLPSSMSGYAPQIRGNANSNAKVEVRQQGHLVYQTTVAPGNFEIKDLYSTGYGGDLEVSVIEATGETQIFYVPYASVVEMLRPGLDRYSVTIGQFNESGIDLKPWFTQAKYQRGLNNYITAYTGVQLLEKYSSVALGAAVGLPIGAVSLDVTHSNADFDYHGTKTGQSYRLSYSKSLLATSTNLTLAAYRYSTEDYYTLRDAARILDYEKKGIETSAIGKQRSQFQVTLNQSLPAGWGNLYIVGSVVDYWNRNEKTQSFNIGYNNRFKALSYGLSVNNRQLIYAEGNSKKDTEYLLSMSFPLSFGQRSVSVNSSYTKNNQNIGLSGNVGDRFNYGISANQQRDSDPSFNINGNYLSNYMSIGGGYNYSENSQQVNLQLSGNVIAHSKGIAFGPDNVDTMAIVYAPDATGAKVTNIRGLTINRHGYAVVPYMTPYRFNDIQLDPSSMSLNVELAESSQRIVPYAGAILKVDFETKSGYAIFIKSKLANGAALPFYSPVYNESKELVGNVAQGGLVYVRTKESQGRLKVKLNDEQQYCMIDYNVADQVKQSATKILMTEAVCKP